MATCAIVSFRLGLTDGVSVVAKAWQAALESLGWNTISVAGDGPVDHLLPSLAIDATAPPDKADLEAALQDVDLVIVENLLSIPLNLPASRVLAECLADRPALLHHHDPPWQRARFAHITELPPDRPQWRHVTINYLTEGQFADRGIEATTIYNGFDTKPAKGDRYRTRESLGLSADDRLFTHPVRAIARKNIPSALQLCQELGGTYWLPGPAEEGYEDELASLLGNATCPIIRTPVDGISLTMADLYAATDLVVFPSTWEGFGNPPIEAALHGRLASVGNYPVADELRSHGFGWFSPTSFDQIDQAISSWQTNQLWATPGKDPDLTARIEQNRQLAESLFSAEQMTAKIKELLSDAGWQA